MGSACASCDVTEGFLEQSAQEIKDQVIRSVDDEVNGSEGYFDKSPNENDDRIAILRGSSTPWSSVDSGTPRLLGVSTPRSPVDASTPRLLGREGSHHKASHGACKAQQPHQLGVIPEQRQASGPSACATLTPRREAQAAAAITRSRNDSMMSNGSMSPACGTPPGTHRCPSSCSMQTTESGQEPRLLAIRFPVSSYAVSDEPVKLPSRHIAFAPSPTHSVHQSEHSVLAYGEIYGEHPMSFEFDADGNMVPRSDSDPETEVGHSRQCIETVRGLRKKKAVKR